MVVSCRVFEGTLRRTELFTKILQRLIHFHENLFPVKITCENHKNKLLAKLNRFELGHEKMCLMSYANNKGADQPVHPRSLISASVVRCLDSIISLDSIAEISRL